MEVTISNMRKLLDEAVCTRFDAERREHEMAKDYRLLHKNVLEKERAVVEADKRSQKTLRMAEHNMSAGMVQCYLDSWKKHYGLDAKPFLDMEPLTASSLGFFTPRVTGESGDEEDIVAVGIETCSEVGEISRSPMTKKKADPRDSVATPYLLINGVA